MKFHITPTVILLTLAGSHSHGTNTEESDVDVRGVCIAPFDVRLSHAQRFEQYESVFPEDLAQSCMRYNPKRFTDLGYSNTGQSWNKALPEDLTIYDIAKAIKLIGECNPNMLELLFADKDDYFIIEKMGERLIQERKKFLTLKAKHTYTGYAISQLKRIERHRNYLLGEVPKKPERSEYGLPEHESLIPQSERNLINEEIANKIRSWTADNIDLAPAERLTLSDNLRSFMAAALKVNDNELDDKLEDTAAESIGFNQDVREILRRERGFREASKKYKSYQNWKNSRNPKRKKLEEKYGWDVKHGSHLIRLSRSGIEILRDGKLSVKREDAEELLDIRRGKRSFEDVKEEAERLFKGINHFYEKNPHNLPNRTDAKYMDSLTREIILMNLK